MWYFVYYVSHLSLPHNQLCNENIIYFIRRKNMLFAGNNPFYCIVCSLSNVPGNEYLPVFR